VPWLRAEPTLLLSVVLLLVLRPWLLLCAGH
jgi:hypothetical protein